MVKLTTKQLQSEKKGSFFNLPVEVHTQIKLLAVKESKTKDDMMLEIITEGIQKI